MTVRRLPPVTRVLIAGDTVSALGTGLVLPLTLIYLHQVRGIPLPVVGALLSMSAAVGLAAVPLTGFLLDRLGARPVLIMVLAGQALAEAGLAWAHSTASAVPALVVLGLSLGPSFPAYSTMLAGVNPEPDTQQRAFAVNFTCVNAGIGAGGAIGAAVASVHQPGSFQSLFLANALSCALFAVVITRLPNPRPQHQAGQTAKPGYREVLGHRALRTVMLASLVTAFTGYAALDSGLPAFATVEARVSVHVVALSLTVNTAVIVVTQLVVLRLVRRMRRSRALAGIGLFWAAAWAVFGLAGLGGSAPLRIACVLTFAGVFGLGETMLAPTIAPLVNSLAQDRIRGRANALSSGTYSIAFVVSPAISTGLIASGLAALWIGLLCAGCLSGVLIAARLGRQLSPEQNRVTAPREEQAVPERTAA